MRKFNINEAFTYSGSDVKYSEAKEWLRDNRLLGKEARKYIDSFIYWLSYNYPEAFSGNPPYTIRIWRNEPPTPDGEIRQKEAWYVPLPRRNENQRGYYSRLRAWLNLFMAYNVCHDKEGEEPCWYLPTHFAAEIGGDEEEEA